MPTSSLASAGAVFDAEPSGPLPPQYAAIESSVRPLPPSALPSVQYYAAIDGPIPLDVDDDAFTASLGPAHRPGILSPVPSELPQAASS
ncbi:hypothetical protein E2562_022733, partial [Oryza meyeriana var. granulata]